MQQSQKLSFKKTNEIDKFLTRLISLKKDEEQIINIRNEKEDITL